MSRYWSYQTNHFHNYLTDEHLKRCIEKFSSFPRPKEWQNLKKRASVLIPLCLCDNEVCLLYTLRTTELRRHSGQVSFPGGMRDGNESAVETAIRETEEEIGIPRESIKVYGCGTPVVRTGMLITPVVGYIGSIVPSDLKINPKEVEYAFALPLKKFCDLSNCETLTFEKCTTPVYSIDGHQVWGLTAFITHMFLKSFLGNEYEFKLKL